MNDYEIFEKPCWIVDILPKQVPKDSPGQYFAVEEYYLREPRISEIRRKYAEILLKLNCYYDLRISTDYGNVWDVKPLPERLEDAIINIGNGSFFAVFEEERSLIVLNGDDTYMTVYDPSERMLDILKQLAAAEGLFVWQP